jgi:hypothetical protein
MNCHMLGLSQAQLSVDDHETFNSQPERNRVWFFSSAIDSRLPRWSLRKLLNAGNDQEYFLHQWST